jgi:hypothetical protein
MCWCVCVCVGFVMWGCFDNMCTCIYSVLYCLYRVFILFRLCIFILISFVCTNERTAAIPWKLNCSINNSNNNNNNNNNMSFPLCQSSYLQAIQDHSQTRRYISLRQYFVAVGNQVLCLCDCTKWSHRPIPEVQSMANKCPHCVVTSLELGWCTELLECLVLKDTWVSE